MGLCIHAQLPLINAHFEISRGASGTNVGLRLHAHLYFEYASGEGSVASAHMRRRARAFVG